MPTKGIVAIGEKNCPKKNALVRYEELFTRELTSVVLRSHATIFVIKIPPPKPTMGEVIKNM